MFYYIIKYGKIEARTTSKEQALFIVKEMQKNETHYLLKADFQIIKGEAAESIKY